MYDPGGRNKGLKVSTSVQPCPFSDPRFPGEPGVTRGTPVVQWDTLRFRVELEGEVGDRGRRVRKSRVFLGSGSGLTSRGHPIPC